jgi:hypothetical protein
MTLVAAWALQSSVGHTHRVGVVADSRITFADGAKFDGFVKALSLGPRSAMVAAGAASPYVTAAELTRPLIASTNWHRDQQRERPLSLWEEAGIFVGFLRPLIEQFESRWAEIHPLIVGFFKDGSAGIVELSLVQERFEARVWRPAINEMIAIASGVQEYAPLVEEALRRSARTGGELDDTISVLHDLAKHQGAPARGIGGGIALGHCRTGMDTFSWRPIEIDGRIFYRGFDYTGRYPPQAPPPKSVAHNPVLFATLEREGVEHQFKNPAHPLAQSVEEGDLGFGTPDLLIGPEPDWVTDESQRIPFEEGAPKK